MLLFEPDADKDTKRIGIIDPSCRVKSVIMEAFQNAAFLCEEYYECAPDIEIKGNLTAFKFSMVNLFCRSNYGEEF
jgi:hypothetical protein